MPIVQIYLQVWRGVIGTMLTSNHLRTVVGTSLLRMKPKRESGGFGLIGIQSIHTTGERGSVKCPLC